MVKSLFFLVSFCTVILFNTLSTVYNIGPEHTKKIPVLTTPVQKKDTAKKSKISVIISKIIKPLKFTANEKIRVEKIIHDYLVKDSIAEATDIKNLQAQIPAMSNQLNKLKVKLDSISKIHPSSAGTKTPVMPPFTPPNNPIKPVFDTTPKVTPVQPLVNDPGANHPVPVIDVKAQQQKIKLIRRLYKAPILDTVFSKNHDSTIIRRISIKHNAQVLGFYADTARSAINDIDFKLITTFVYAINIDKSSYGLTANANLIDSAQKEGCNIILSVYTNSVQNTQRFLSNNSAKINLIERTIGLMRKTKATGININLAGLDNGMRAAFVTFISTMYNIYQDAPEHFKISVTLPDDDKCVAYDITALNQFTHLFIVDFSKRPNTPEALAPLNNGSNNSVETCFSYYLGKGIDASKFILCVPYYGVEWQKAPKTFMRYITYNDVRNKYSDSIKIYNPGESAVYMDMNLNKPAFNMWYDDDKTLGQKYDYALNNALGGIAIKYLGDDNRYGELEDELAYKMIKVDTSIISITRNNFKTSLVNFLKQLTENPCNHVVNPTYSHILGIINICFIVLLIIIALILFFQVKKYGDIWKYKQPLIYVLIGTSVVWSVVLLMWLFFWSKNPFFGQSSGHCIDISFATLFIILVAGTGIGLFIRWVYQLNKNDEKP